MDSILFSVLLFVGVYVLLGLAVIVVFDYLTNRIRRRIRTAAIQTQVLIGESERVAVIVTLLATWLFWPALLYAALFKGSRKGTHSDSELGHGA